MMRKLTVHICLACVLVLSSVGYAEWHDAAAQVRVQIATVGSPSHDSAGYIVVIPDGGILPGSKVSIITESGARLKSALLWHSRDNGLAVVFEAKVNSAEKLYAYISMGQSPVWTPDTGLTPSYYHVTDPSVADMRAAQALRKLGPVKPQVHFDRMEPFDQGKYSADYALMSDVTGRPRPMSVYALTYLDISEAGKVFFAPSIGPGTTMELRIDGKVLEHRRVHPAWGGMGDEVNLTKGLHLCEVLAFSAGIPAGATDEGIMFLCMKLPGTKYKDIAGVWGEDETKTQYPPGCKKGEPKQASRPVMSSEIVKSGRCVVKDIEQKAGKPVAGVSVEIAENCWGLASGAPALVCVLKSIAVSNPADTEYTWSFNDGSQMNGATVVRFLPGMQEQRIMLTASTKAGQSKCSVPFYGYSDVESNLDEEKCRTNIRSAFLGSIRAFPLEKDPTATWSENIWACFFASQELGKGEALLAEVLTKRWKFFKPKMTLDQQEDLKEKFFQFVSYYSPDQAIAWLKEGARTSPDMEERKRMNLLMAEVYMYHKIDYEQAKKLLKEIAGGGRNSDSAIRAQIRLGDVAFLERDLNTANNYWGAVQNGVDISRDILEGSAGSKEWKPTSLKKAKSKEEKAAEAAVAAAAAKKDKKKGAKKEDAFTSAIKDGNANVDNWKQVAVMETTLATEVISLMNQGFWDEAYKNLHLWERGFPLSKISGDYIIQEAQYFEKTGNIQRARILLEAYCDNVEASAFLAKAAGNLLTLMVNARDDKKVIVEFCEKMKKRFEFHPLADRMNDMMGIYGENGVKRENIKLDF